MISIFYSIVLADILAGLFHWWEDRYGNPDWPILGKYIIQPNIKHHLEPAAFCKGNYFKRNWTTFIGTLPFALVFYLLNYQVLALAFLIASQSNEIHCWSHIKKNKLIRILQRYYIIQSPKQHAIHHKRPYDKNYCVMTSFMNPILSTLKFWNILEYLVGLFGIFPRKERSVA